MIVLLKQILYYHSNVEVSVPRGLEQYAELRADHLLRVNATRVMLLEKVLYHVSN